MSGKRVSQTMLIYDLTSLDVRSWTHSDVSVTKAAFLSGDFRGELVSVPFPVSDGHLDSLACASIPPSLKSEASHL